MDAGPARLLASDSTKRAGEAHEKRCALLAMRNFNSLLRDGLLARGKNWPKDHPTRECVARLFGVDKNTIKNWMSDVNTLAEDNPDVPKHDLTRGPRKRGPEKMSTEESREKYKNLYEVVCQRFVTAKQNQEVLTVDKLLNHVRVVAKQRKKENEKLEWVEVFSDEKRLKDSFEALRYHLRRLGFQYGAICFSLKSYRSRPYVMAWLHNYSDQRCKALVDGVLGRRQNVVDVFADETGLWKHEHGRFSWYHEGQNAWDKIRRRKGEKFGICQFIFSWWESVDGFDDLSEHEQSVVKSHGKKIKTFFTRRCAVFRECLSVWNVRGDGHMNGKAFEETIEGVCDFINDGHFARLAKLGGGGDRRGGRAGGRAGARKVTAVFHLDNASYHKRKKAKGEFDPKKQNITAADCIEFLQDNSPEFQNTPPEDLIDPDTGDLYDLESLRMACAGVWRPNYVEQILHRKGHGVRWSAPYWSEGMPVELYWAGMKQDYRSYDKKWRDKITMEKYCAKYAGSVEDFELKGMVEHTDRVMRRVQDRDPSLLNPLELSNMPAFPELFESDGE